MSELVLFLVGVALGRFVVPMIEKKIKEKKAKKQDQDNK